MKIVKLSLVIVLSILSCVLYSQEHLKFKGIPIDGTVDPFVRKLVDSGCQILIAGGKNESTFLKGEFVNKQCTIAVAGTQKTNTVCSIIVFLPTETNWSNIKNDYLKLKQQFQQKYGIGESDEYFSEPYCDGDGREMRALELNKCTYKTLFFADEGTILFVINPSIKAISICYGDRINMELREKEETEIIHNDI